MNKGAIAAFALSIVAVLVLVLGSMTKKAKAQPFKPAAVGQPCPRYVMLVGYSDAERDTLSELYEKQNTPFKPYLKGQKVHFTTLPAGRDPYTIYSQFVPAVRQAEPSAIMLFVFKDRMRHGRDYELVRQTVLPTSTPGQALGFAVVEQGWGMIAGWQVGGGYTWAIQHELLHLLLVGTWHVGWEDPADLTGKQVKRPQGAELLPWWKCALKVDRL